MNNEIFCVHYHTYSFLYYCYYIVAQSKHDNFLETARQPPGNPLETAQQLCGKQKEEGNCLMIKTNRENGSKRVCTLIDEDSMSEVN